MSLVSNLVSRFSSPPGNLLVVKKKITHLKKTLKIKIGYKIRFMCYHLNTDWMAFTRQNNGIKPQNNYLILHKAKKRIHKSLQLSTENENSKARKKTNGQAIAQFVLQENVSLTFAPKKTFFFCLWKMNFPLHKKNKCNFNKTKIQLRGIYKQNRITIELNIYFSHGRVCVQYGVKWIS